MIKELKTRLEEIKFSILNIEKLPITTARKNLIKSLKTEEQYIKILKKLFTLFIIMMTMNSCNKHMIKSWKSDIGNRTEKICDGF